MSLIEHISTIFVFCGISQTSCTDETPATNIKRIQTNRSIDVLKSSDACQPMYLKFTSKGKYSNNIRTVLMCAVHFPIASRCKSLPSRKQHGKQISLDRDPSTVAAGYIFPLLLHHKHDDIAHHDTSRLTSQLINAWFNCFHLFCSNFGTPRNLLP